MGKRSDIIYGVPMQTILPPYVSYKQKNPAKTRICARVRYSRLKHIGREPSAVRPVHHRAGTIMVIEEDVGFPWGFDGW